MTRPTKAQKPPNLLSTSALAKKAGLNRATVRERLEQGKVRPKQEGAKEKLYDEAEALAALQGGDGGGLRKAQTAKTTAEALRAKLKLERERGELVPIREVREDLHRLVKRIHEHFAVTAPRDLALRLRAMSAGEFEATLRGDAEQFFNELRAEHESYL